MRQELHGYSVAQLVLGFIVLICGSGSLFHIYLNERTRVYSRPNSTLDKITISSGVCVGMWVILSSTLGIIASKPESNRCLIGLATMFSFLTVLLAGGLSALISMALFDIGGDFPEGSTADRSRWIPVLVLNVGELGSGLLIFIFSIASSAYSCLLLRHVNRGGVRVQTHYFM